MDKKAIDTQESHEVWKAFQPKFDLTMELYNYAQFFEMILYRVCKDLVKQMVTVVEWKHIFGMIFNEDGPIGLKEEIAIFERVQKTIQNMFPLFQMKIISCGLKGLPPPMAKQQVQAAIDAVFECQEFTNMCIGFDMVQEEDMV